MRYYCKLGNFRECLFSRINVKVNGYTFMFPACLSEGGILNDFLFSSCIPG